MQRVLGQITKLQFMVGTGLKCEKHAKNTFFAGWVIDIKETAIKDVIVHSLY